MTDSNPTSKWGWHLWLGSFYFLILFFSVMLSMWIVRYAMMHGPRLTNKQADTVLLIASFPSTLKNIFYSILPQPYLLLIDRSKAEKLSWTRHFPASEDSGYLLFSGLDPVVRHGIVSLIRISDGKEVARWDPDWSDILNNISNQSWRPTVNVKSVLPTHPLLLDDGAIIFKTSNDAMVRINVCERKPAWVIDKEILHHSNEMSFDGTIWSPGVAHDAFPKNSWLTEHLRDDALVRVSTEGKVLEKRSFSHILLTNHLEVMLLGRSGLLFNEDPIHLNQISIAIKDSPYWKQGDLLISARHLSTVFLYRPSSNKIIWFKQGPWMNQHSALFIDDHRISIFDNHVFGGAPETQPFVSPSSINRVFVYDFANKKFSQPFKELLSQSKPVTMTAGRSQVLPDGGLFIEETESGRHLRFSSKHLIWSRVNDFDAQHIGLVSWSRYLTADEAKKSLDAIANSPKCNQKVGSLSVKVKS